MSFPGGQPSRYNIEPVSGILLAPRAQIDSSSPIDTRARNCLTFSEIGKNQLISAYKSAKINFEIFLTFFDIATEYRTAPLGYAVSLTDIFTVTRHKIIP